MKLQNLLGDIFGDLLVEQGAAIFYRWILNRMLSDGILL
jgi:hypothetical protein